MAADRRFDLLIVGGGINGAGIARDAAGRGLKVLLVEQHDLAAHTSSASTKLIHGGLRYLEQGEFNLVREALVERERLLRIAPHLVRPLDFVIVPGGGARPAWMLRLGLFAYDRLGGGSSLARTRRVALADRFGDGLAARSGTALAYADAQVDDSRLVVSNALDAARRGAQIRTRTRLTAARRDGGEWLASLEGTDGVYEVRARALVNAAGPWVGELAASLSAKPRAKVRLVKGSHVVVPRLFDGEHAFLIQNPDRRILFAIPYEEQFTLLGTTEQEWLGPPGTPTIDAAETDYLLAAANRLFERQTGRDDIRWSYSGIRPLVHDGSGDPSRNTRGYVLELDGEDAPLVSVFGGKITTFRQLAERALDRLARWLPGCRSAWTADAVLPGGDLPDPADFARRYPFLGEALACRLVRSYGSRAGDMLGDARSLADLGQHFGAGLYAREIDYLVAEEWARSAEDILYRRSKLGLHLAPELLPELDAYVTRTVIGRSNAA